MVHALEEIRRVLAPGGVLIDLRPVADSWPVEVTTGSETHEIGRVVDLPAQLADDAASDEAFVQAAGNELFELEQASAFEFVYSWEDPTEMAAYIAEQWEEYIALSDDVLTKTAEAWKRSGPGSRVGLRVKMYIARWRKDFQRT